MTKKLWGGGFTKKTDPLVEEFTKSIQYDYKLTKYDIISSIVHVKVLEKSGFLTKDESNRLCSGLVAIRNKIKEGKLKIGHLRFKRSSLIDKIFSKENVLKLLRP